jgi:ribonuclease HI
VSRRLVVEADGGSRGNPGQAGSGTLVIDPESGEVLAEIGIYVGIASNNVAEYRAMLAGVTKALEIDPHAELHVRMDSKLVVEQMSGRWKIKHPDMADLARQAHAILAGTEVSFEWIPRLENSRADRLANEAMDKRLSFER